MVRELIASARSRFLKPVLERQEQIHDSIRFAHGVSSARALEDLQVSDLHKAEFSAFSQFGEDGIIDYLVDRVEISARTFVEIGVEDYSESNTRFLLQNRSWAGLIIDRDSRHVEYAERRELRWRYGLEPIQAHVTRDNINEIIQMIGGLRGDIGLLSIDVDGVDYWLLESLTAVTPRILVVEYNSIFGPDHAVTVPYSAGFDRSRAHWSHLYYGASLAALTDLAKKRGNVLVGSTSAGNNAFFVREDLAGDLPRPSVGEAYVRSPMREARAKDGSLLYCDSHTDGLSLIAGLPLLDTRSGNMKRVQDLFPDAARR